MTAFMEMKVIARSTSSRRRERVRGDRPAGELKVTDRRTAADLGSSRRIDPPQDHALYSCACGFVFDATVSTTVSCPHCGGAQAW